MNLKYIAIIGVVVFLIIGGLAYFGMMPSFPLTTYEPYKGWKLEGEIFDKESYEGLADITLSGKFIYSGDFFESSPYPRQYWYNLWYKQDGSNDWEMIAGVDDETNDGGWSESIISGYDIFRKHDAKLSPPDAPSFVPLKSIKSTLLMELDGELRVDIRVQMIHPGLTLYDEHTMGSDYAMVSPVDIDNGVPDNGDDGVPDNGDDGVPDNGDDGKEIPGFELVVLFIAISIVFFVFKRKKG